MGGKNSTALDQPIKGVLKNTLDGHNDAIVSCSISPNEKYLASCSSDRKVIIWDMKNFKCLKEFEPHKSDVNAISFSPDSTALLTCSKASKISLWDVKTLNKIYSSRIISGSITHCTFSMDTSKYFAACSGEGSLIMFETQGDTVVKKEKQAHQGMAFQVCYSPDNIHLASCGNDKKIILWNRSTGKKTATISNKYSRILTCQFNLSGTLIAGVVDGEKVRIWSAVTFEVVSVLEDHHIAPIVCCVFSPINDLIATGSGDKTFAVWDPSEPHPMPAFHLKAHDNWIQTIAFSPSGKYLITGSMDKKLHIWM